VTVEASDSLVTVGAGAATGAEAGITVSEMLACLGLLFLLGTVVVVAPGSFLGLALVLRFGVAITTAGDAEAATLLTGGTALMSVGKNGPWTAELSSGNGAGASRIGEVKAGVVSSTLGCSEAEISGGILSPTF
jgi:hypothetical protein